MGVGRATVDHFGDSVMAAPLPGDTWRTKHDTIKTSIHGLLLWSGLRADCGVYGLFSHLIPAQDPTRGEGLEWGRKRQALLPDFRLELPNPLGTTDSTLAELKTIGAVCSRYPRGNRNKAVERRAGLLQGEYVRKVARVDQQVLGTPRGEVGPLQRKLESFGDILGLVVGAFGEGSADLHDLVHTMARSRLRVQGLAEGREGSETVLGVITGQVRHTLSTATIRAQSLCLLACLDKMGEG